MHNKIGLSPDKISLAREHARDIVAPIMQHIHTRSTTSIERATLRLLGAEGADAEGVPTTNLLVDGRGPALATGASRIWINALLHQACDPIQLASRVTEGLDIWSLPLREEEAIRRTGEKLVAQEADRISVNAAFRQARIQQWAANEKDPMLYVIVATGNIHEDVSQARSAAEQGADIIAVIRTTAQSLLDYVPQGATTEGFGGTYATRENFRIMRAALDEAGSRLQRYIRLVNYCSGLCMPEIAALGAMERLDMMLNDSMYGILFRDINMHRTFVDQHFSRMINALAGITINTGEDNYLTTSDAVESAHTVLASQLLNEQFALEAGLQPEQIGLGHAFEIDPELQDGFLLEIAHAQMAREIFPKCPLKYMPPTRFMDGNIFRGIVMNTLFNFASRLTGQRIHLLGMLTEAIHTPHLQDRHLAIANARHVMESMAGLADEVEFRSDGKIVNRAREVLEETIRFLNDIRDKGLFTAIESGYFAEVSRAPHAGKGLDGVFKKAPEYWNPWMDYLEKSLIKNGGQS